MTDESSLREVLKGLAAKWRERLNKCVGYPDCDGDLVGLSHSDKCPEKGRKYEPLTVRGCISELAALASQPSGVETDRTGELIRTNAQLREALSGVSVQSSGPHQSSAIASSEGYPGQNFFHENNTNIRNAENATAVRMAFDLIGKAHTVTILSLDEMEQIVLRTLGLAEPVIPAAATQSPASSRPARGIEVSGEPERLVRVDEHLRTCTRCKANLHSHCDRWNQLMALAARSTHGEPLSTSEVPGERIKKLIEDLEGLKTHAKESSDGVGYQEGRYRAFAAMLTALKHELAVATPEETPQPLQTAASPGSERERGKIHELAKNYRSDKYEWGMVFSYADWDKFLTALLAVQPTHEREGK